MAGVSKHPKVGPKTEGDSPPDDVQDSDEDEAQDETITVDDSMLQKLQERESQPVNSGNHKPQTQPPVVSKEDEDEDEEVGTEVGLGPVNEETVEYLNVKDLIAASIATEEDDPYKDPAQVTVDASPMIEELFERGLRTPPGTPSEGSTEDIGYVTDRGDKEDREDSEEEAASQDKTEEFDDTPKVSDPDPEQLPQPRERPVPTARLPAGYRAPEEPEPETAEDEEPTISEDVSEAPRSDTIITPQGEVDGASGPVGETRIMGNSEKRPTLAVDTGSRTTELELTKDETVIGRAAGCELVLADLGVSRRHAVVERRGEAWFVADMGSGNGTFVNLEKVQESQLFDGDVIGVGSSTIVFLAPELGKRPPKEEPESTGEALAVAGTGEQKALGKAKPRRKRKRLLYVIALLVAVLGVLGVVKKMSVKSAPPGPTPEQVAAREEEERYAAAQETFQQVKELVRKEQWAEAQPLILAITEEYPEDKEIQKYKTEIVREAEVAKDLGAAREKMNKEDFAGAVAELDKVPPDSPQVQVASDLKAQAGVQLKEKKQKTLKEAFDAKNYADAIALADEILVSDPKNDIVREIRARAERKLRAQEKEAAAKEKKGKTGKVVKKRHTGQVAKKSSTILLGPSLAAYLEGNMDQALAQAPTAGVDGDGQAALLKQQGLCKDGAELARQPAQSEAAIKTLVEALQLDAKLGGGRGKVAEDIRAKLGKVFFLKGVDAHNRKDYPEAYKNYQKALNYRSDLKEAQVRLKDLESEANRLYETAYVLKSTNPEKALNSCETVKKMVPPTNHAYERCNKLLEQLRGGGGGEKGPDDGF